MLLCADAGEPATTRGGAAISDFLKNEGVYSELDRQTTSTNGYGGSAQLTASGPVGGLHNQLVAGLSVDGARSTFSATSRIGGLIPDMRVFVGPSTVIDQPGDNVPVRAGIANATIGVLAATRSI